MRRPGGFLPARRLFGVRRISEHSVPADAPAARRSPLPLSLLSSLRERVAGAAGLRLPQPRGRLRASIRRSELSGLAFAFRARTFAIVVVSLWLAYIVPWPRDAYYLGLAAIFFLLGYIPYRLRHHRHAERIKLGFVVLDVALVTAAILIPPPAGLGVEWPAQTRVRGPEFLYLLLLLAEAALTFSPVAVIWTGLCIAAIWSIGFQILYDLPSTTRFVDVAQGARLTAQEALRVYLDPTFVGVTQWRTQLVATALFTVILATAVWRGRSMMFAQMQAELVRADLARYVSPDVADALSARTSAGFGEPAVRDVAVLFADVVGFTGMTEELPPERTFALLRSFHQRSCRVVFEHGGTLDKFLGDGFMATFGGLEAQPDSASRALACAFALRDEVAAWTAKRRARGAAPVRIAIGVHCGAVVVGNLGAAQRLEFTVVGDVVNLASRLEEATRMLGATIAVSETCLAAAGRDEWLGKFEGSTEMTLRGRSTTIRIHTA
jgi:adenylate cyclase